MATKQQDDLNALLSQGKRKEEKVEQEFQPEEKKIIQKRKIISKGMSKTTVLIDVEIHKKIAVLSKIEGSPLFGQGISEIVEKAVQVLLSKKENDRFLKKYEEVMKQLKN